MAPRLIEEGKIQVLGQTANSVVYAVANDSNTGLARDSSSVLKGGTVWYEGREALGPGKDADESDERARKEAKIYKIMGKHERILKFHGLETSFLDGQDLVSKAWAVRLERAPHGSLRDNIVSSSADPPNLQTRLQLTVQFAEGVAYLHRHGVIWGDLSTRNVFLFDGWRIKLGDFADSDLEGDYPHDWYGCEARYCPPGSPTPHLHTDGTMNREMFALGSAICEIVEWRVPYGSGVEVPEEDVMNALDAGEWPRLSSDNPAKAVIRSLWDYLYKSSGQVVDELQSVVLHHRKPLSL